MDDLPQENVCLNCRADLTVVRCAACCGNPMPSAFATHATEPAPVAVEGAPDAGAVAFADYFRRNYPGPDTIIFNPDWHAPRIYRNAVAAYRATAPRADLAPTGNTALVEWCNEHEALVRGCIDLTAKEEATALLWINNFRAVLSQPAAPQPTPEVEALVYERDRNQASRQWHMKKRKEAEADRDRYKEMYEAALARGSVAEKGEG